MNSQIWPNIRENTAYLAKSEQIFNFVLLFLPHMFQTTIVRNNRTKQNSFSTQIHLLFFVH